AARRAGLRPVGGGDAGRRLLGGGHQEADGHHRADGRARHASRRLGLRPGAGACRRQDAGARHAARGAERPARHRGLYRRRRRERKGAGMTAVATKAAQAPAHDAKVVLSVRNIESYYGPIMAIRGVSLEVREGQIVTVLGANGAGKTTLMKTISGVMDPEKGQILYQGRDIAGQSPDRIVRAGIV